MSHVSPLPVRRGLSFVLFAAVAWGTGGATGALLQRGGALSPLGVAFWRLAIAALIVSVAVRDVRADRRALAVGPLMAVNQAAYFAAIASSGVAFATMVTMGVMPVLATLAARVFLKEPLTRTALAGIGLAVAGVILMADLTNAASLGGAGFAVLSATAYAGMTVVTKASFQRSALAWRFGAGALCLLPVTVIAGGLVPAASALPGLAYLGAVPTALAYGLFFTGLGSVRVATAAVIALLEPLVGAIIGVTLLGERLTGGQVAGGALLLTAVVVTALADLTPSRVIANTREP